MRRESDPRADHRRNCGGPCAQLRPELAPDSDQDPDEDTLPNLTEYTIETNPTLPDTDGDGLTDGFETITIYPNGEKTDPLLSDTDSDELTDGYEYTTLYLNDLKTNPTLSDTDDDGLSDKFEVDTTYEITNQKTNPTVSDSDQDGLPDGVEFIKNGANYTGVELSKNSIKILYV